MFGRALLLCLLGDRRVYNLLPPHAAGRQTKAVAVVQQDSAVIAYIMFQAYLGCSWAQFPHHGLDVGESSRCYAVGCDLLALAVLALESEHTMTS